MAITGGFGSASSTSGITLKSPDGGVHALRVDNSGALSTVLAPSAVQSLAMTRRYAGAGTLQVTWSAPATGTPDGYEIVGVGAVVSQVGTTKNWSALVGDEDYTVYVRAYVLVGPTGSESRVYGPVATISTDTVPGTPSAPTVVAVSSGSAVSISDASTDAFVDSLAGQTGFRQAIAMPIRPTSNVTISSVGVYIGGQANSVLHEGLGTYFEILDGSFTALGSTLDTTAWGLSQWADVDLPSPVALTAGVPYYIGVRSAHAVEGGPYLWLGYTGDRAHLLGCTVGNDLQAIAAGSPTAWSPLTALVPTIMVRAKTAEPATAVNVTFAAPSDDGGAAITGYTVELDGSDASTATDTPSAPGVAAFTGLTIGVTYTAKVKATNSVGAGSFSADSGSVTL